jgi:hypothetical protein
VQIHDLDYQTTADRAIVGGALTASAFTAEGASGLGRSSTVDANSASRSSILRVQTIRITSALTNIVTNSQAKSQGSSTASVRNTPLVYFDPKNGLNVISSGRATSTSGGTVGT